MKFKTKIDNSLIIFIILFPLLSTYIGKIRNSFTVKEFILQLLVVYIFVFCVSACIFTVEYIIDEKELIIKNFLFKKKIKYENIYKIKRKMGRYSGSTASMQQLVLFDKKGKKIISLSPKDIDEFEQEIRKKIINL